MRHAVPPTRESEAALKQRLPYEHDGNKKPRLHTRYLLVTQHTQDRQKAACLQGVHRNTMSCWLALYAAGGLDAVLEPSAPAGKPVSVAPAVRAGSERALHPPEGFVSCEVLRQRVRRAHREEERWTFRQC